MMMLSDAHTQTNAVNYLCLKAEVVHSNRRLRRLASRDNLLQISYDFPIHEFSLLHFGADQGARLDVAAAGVTGAVAAGRAAAADVRLAVMELMFATAVSDARIVAVGSGGGNGGSFECDELGRRGGETGDDCSVSRRFVTRCGRDFSLKLVPRRPTTSHAVNPGLL